MMQITPQNRIASQEFPQQGQVSVLQIALQPPSQKEKTSFTPAQQPQQLDQAGKTALFNIFGPGLWTQNPAYTSFQASAVPAKYMDENQQSTPLGKQTALALKNTPNLRGVSFIDYNTRTALAFIVPKDIQEIAKYMGLPVKIIKNAVEAQETAHKIVYSHSGLQNQKNQKIKTILIADNEIVGDAVSCQIKGAKGQDGQRFTVLFNLASSLDSMNDMPAYKTKQDLVTSSIGQVLSGSSSKNPSNFQKGEDFIGGLMDFAENNPRLNKTNFNTIYEAYLKHVAQQSGGKWTAAQLGEKIDATVTANLTSEAKKIIAAARKP